MTMKLFFLEDIFLTGMVANQCSKVVERIHSESFVTKSQAYPGIFRPETDIVLHLDDPEENIKILWKNLSKFIIKQRQIKGLSV
jgi:hypothetical protein